MRTIVLPHRQSDATHLYWTPKADLANNTYVVAKIHNKRHEQNKVDTGTENSYTTSHSQP